MNMDISTCVDRKRKEKHKRDRMKSYKFPKSSFGCVFHGLILFFLLLVFSTSCSPYYATNAAEKVFLINESPMQSGNAINAFGLLAFNGCKDYFNLQQAGTGDASCKFLVVNFSDPNSVKDVANANPDVEHIIGVGFLLDTPVHTAAKALTQRTFSVVDVPSNEPSNLEGLVFAEDEAGFLAGVLAGLVTQTKIVGVVGGIPVPAVLKFVNGYTAGVHAVCRTCRVVGGYTPSFQNAEIGRAIGDKCVSGGADVVFGAGGATGSAAIEHVAANYSKWVIGVDSDESQTTFRDTTTQQLKSHGKYLLSSALKRVDVAVRLTLENRYSSSFKGGNKLLTSSLNAVSLSPCSSTEACAEYQKQLLFIDPHLSESCLNTYSGTVEEILQIFTARLKSSDIAPWVDSNGLFTNSSTNTTNVFKEMLAIGEQPDKRVSGHSFVRRPKTLEFYQFGGESASSHSGDFHVFNYTEQLWHMVAKFQSGSTPGPRSFHGSFIFDDHLYIYGGRNSSLDGIFEDMWKWSFSSKTWTQLSFSGNSPGKRQAFCYTSHESKFYIFGGVNRDIQLSNELWEFDAATDTWSQISLQGHIPQPLQRCSLTPMVSNKTSILSLYMFGGESFTGVTNFMYRITPSTKESVLLPSDGTVPPGTSLHQAQVINGDHIAIFAGKSSVGNIATSKTFVFDTSTWIWSSYLSPLPHAMHSFASASFNGDGFSCLYDPIPFFELCKLYSIDGILIHGGLKATDLLGQFYLFYPPTAPVSSQSSTPVYEELYFIIPIAVFLVLLVCFGYWYYRKRRFNENPWLMQFSSLEEIHFVHAGDDDTLKDIENEYSILNNSNSDIMSRMTGYNRVAKYSEAFFNGNRVTLFMSSSSVSLTDSQIKELNNTFKLRHVNVLTFVGACVSPPHICAVYESTGKGDLKDIIHDRDKFRLEWLFRYAILADICAGLKYIYDSRFQFHGGLTPDNCFVDHTWRVKLFGFSLRQFLKDEFENEESTTIEKEAYKLLYVAPELVQITEEKHTLKGGQSLIFTTDKKKSSEKKSLFTDSLTVEINPLGSPKGDIYSFGMIMFELANRMEIYEEVDDIDAQGLLVRVKFEGITPKIVKDAPEAIKMLAHKCIGRDPSSRPSIQEAMKTIKKSNPDDTNLVETMAKMFEAYTESLEAKVNERTEELQVEKEIVASLLRRTKTLLKEILPESVAESLLSGQSVAPESYNCVTIYFSDVCGFTDICSKINPLQVVGFLNDIYVTFDKNVALFDVYKVETIGDAYMVVSGLPQRNGDNHAHAICSLAVNLQAAIKTFTSKYIPETELAIRIGINSGPCVAGVVGTKMPRYCLFGDTVNVASRMETTGEPMKIHISKSTADFVHANKKFKLTERGQIPIKGKGEMTTFWLESTDVLQLPSAGIGQLSVQHSTESRESILHSFLEPMPSKSHTSNVNIGYAMTHRKSSVPLPPNQSVHITPPHPKTP
eukprot:Nk52_evm10s62 gene=Nk52_evmTU10s62